MRCLRLAALVAALAACSDSSGPSAPAALTRVSEDTARVRVGESTVVAVRVSDRRGRALPDIDVAWQLSGTGTLTASGSRSDATGVASVEWAIGTQPGTHSLTATVAGLSPLVFTAVVSSGPPAAMVAAVELPPSAVTGTDVAPSPAVFLSDAHGNAVTGEPVTFTIVAGGGSVTAASAVTDSSGTATPGLWRLGTAAGTNSLAASAGDLEPVTFSITGLAGAPASVAHVEGNAQTATVGTAVSTRPAVMVRDRNHNPVPGATVRFTVTAGGGTLTGDTQTTDADGMARVGSWTLGTTVGTNTLRAAAGPVNWTFSATATPGGAATVQIVAGDGQTGAPGYPLPTVPSVRVRDTHGNPVPGVDVHFAVTAGGGSIDSAVVATNAIGVAAAGAWTLGPLAGENALTASVDGAEPIAFTAAGVDGVVTFNLSIDGVHLNQGSQRADGSIGAVAGRGGMLRVVVRANQANSTTPAVRVRLFQGAVMRREALIPSPGSGVPTAPDLARVGDTWNLVLSPAEVEAGLTVEAVVDPGNTIPVANPDDRRWPRGSGTASLDVAVLHPLRIVFLPIHSTFHFRTGSITAGNLGDYLAAARQWIPGSSIAAVVRDPYTTQLDLREPANWSTLLSELQAVRTAEGAKDEYYHGIVGDFSGIAYAGLAYRPTSPASSFRTGLSYDRMPGAPGTIAHELGHNLGRMHTPCGSAGATDPAYPHAGAAIGSPGFDILSGTLQAASNLRDYMSYCSPRWTSDYTYDAIVQWRRADPHAVPAVLASAARQPRTGVLLFGTISDHGVVLNPAFALTAPASLPTAPGASSLRGFAADGTELFRLSFDGESVADSDDPDERHFAFFVPLGTGEISRLASVELATPRGVAVRRAAAATPAATPGIADANAEIVADAGDRLRVRWDASSFPMALVRNARTGHVLGFARGGDAAVIASGAAADIEVLVSDGVRSGRAPRR